VLTREVKPNRVDDTPVLETVTLPTLEPDALTLRASGGKVRCIKPVPEQVLTEVVELEPTLKDSEVVSDAERDLAKLVCFERHGKNGNVAVALVTGFGLQRGALASTVGHDHHNLLAVGMDDDDLLTAARRLEALGGGFVVVAGGEVLAELPLEIAGLITQKPLEEVRRKLDELEAAAARLGVGIPSPFMTLSFLGLAVIPELRLTDMGLVDVNASELVSLAVG
jgi:adenine deaminase